MKKTKYVDLDMSTLKEGVRNQLTSKAQHVVNNLGPTVAQNITEAYTDQPYVINPTVKYYTRNDVKRMLSSWETPNADDFTGSYSANMDNPAHRSSEGIAKLDGEEPVTPEDADKTIEIDTEGEESDRERTLRLLKSMYQLEEGADVKTVEVDPEDGDDYDESEYKAALVKAHKDGESISIELDDDSEIDIDPDTIKKILDSDELFHKTIKNMGSIDSFTKALGIGLNEAEELEESVEEEIELPESLLEMYNYLESIQADALYDMHDDMFAESTINLDKLAKSIQASGGSNRNRQERGKIALVNRIRGGKLQMRKAVSNKKGYKIKNGQAVRMMPAEIKKRKISARVASKKRRNQMSQINRKRGISLNIRNSRLG